MFRYDDIQWTSTGNEAVTGINVGDSVNHVTIPGLHTPSILNVEETSNVGDPGVWIFETGEAQGNHMHIHAYNFAYKHACYICISLMLS